MKTQVWPVIHVADSPRAIACADAALRCGCDGVMMISMAGDNETLDRVAVDVSNSRASALRLGVNYLGLRSADAVLRSQALGFDATWTDLQEFTRGELSPDAKGINGTIRPGHKFFAAVAFKGQEPDPFPGDSAALAAHFGHIPTTSGLATGHAPDVEKIAAIRRRLHPADPLAIASGVTPQNVASFAPHVTHVLVSTGISKNFHEFDEDRLAALVAALTRVSYVPGT